MRTGSWAVEKKAEAGHGQALVEEAGRADEGEQTSSHPGIAEGWGSYPLGRSEHYSHFCRCFCLMCEAHVFLPHVRGLRSSLLSLFLGDGLHLKSITHQLLLSFASTLQGLLASIRIMEKVAPLRCVFLLLLALVVLPSVQGVEKVKVELYSESLCPYCASFIINYLNPFFNNGLIDIVELRIIPYGNARVHSDGKLVCQHGPDECELNIIQTCAIRLWPKVTDWFPFIYCLETLDRSTAAKKWKSCVLPSHLDLDPLLECSTTALGAKLEMEFAAETDRLQPPHKYVPWVLVNGEPLYDNYEDVATYVCKAYQGNKPAVCSRLEHEYLEKAHSARVCAKEDLLSALY